MVIETTNHRVDDKMQHFGCANKVAGLNKAKFDLSVRESLHFPGLARGAALWIPCNKPEESFERCAWSMQMFQNTDRSFFHRADVRPLIIIAQNNQT